LAASQTSCEAIWLRKLLVGIFGVQMRPTAIYCDNQSCIKLSENPVFHDRFNTSRLDITSSGIMFREEQLSYNIYLQMSRLRTSLLKLWGETSLYCTDFWRPYCCISGTEIEERLQN
jgi:hypothetical protein